MLISGSDASSEIMLSHAPSSSQRFPFSSAGQNTMCSTPALSSLRACTTASAPSESVMTILGVQSLILRMISSAVERGFVFTIMMPVLKQACASATNSKPLETYVITLSPFFSPFARKPFAIFAASVLHST